MKREGGYGGGGLWDVARFSDELTNTSFLFIPTQTRQISCFCRVSFPFYTKQPAGREGGGGGLLLLLLPNAEKNSPSTIKMSTKFNQRSAVTFSLFIFILLLFLILLLRLLLQQEASRVFNCAPA